MIWLRVMIVLGWCSGCGANDVGELVLAVEDGLAGDVGAEDEAELVIGCGQLFQAGRAAAICSNQADLHLTLTDPKTALNCFNDLQ